MSESVEASGVSVVVEEETETTSSPNLIIAEKVDLMEGGNVTATPAATTTTMVVGKPVVENVASQLTIVSSTPSTSNKDNVIVIVSKMEPDKGGGKGGDVKLVGKPITMSQMVAGSQVLTAGGAILKKRQVTGSTLVKVQNAGGSPQTSPLGKRNIVISSRPGVNQIITCAPMMGQQHAHGSTPVILTQKVASGGMITSPVVSTGGISSAALTNIMGMGGHAKIVASPSSPQTQQRQQDVRVDNWGNYCLQRLQTMYDKSDFCDLTLRFHSSQEIKVHRVVVNLCTEYFSNLEKLYGLTDGTLILPKDVEFQTMQTIIRFFYTGKLEVRGTQFNDIYRTVKMMNITILIKLLEAHSRKPATQVKKDAGRVVLKQAVDLGKGQKGQVQIQVATSQHQTSSPVIAVPVQGSKTLQVAAPGAKLPPGVKTKTVLARVQPQTSKSPSQATGKATPKKLPIWKERKYTPVTSEQSSMHKWPIKEEEPARPTRFEWGDPDEPDPFLSSSLTNHALMEKQKEKHSSTSSRKAEDIFDSVKNQNQSGVKRSQPEPDTASSSASPGNKPPAPKISKLELVQLPSGTPSSVETIDDQNSVNLSEDTIVEEVTTSAPEDKHIEKKPAPILKPALKSPGAKLAKSPPGAVTKGALGTCKDTASPQKTVRFAPEVEKENKEKGVSPRIEVPVSSTSTEGSTGDPLVNHSKIISEVLRKFPDLVKDNKNIKLKIVQKPMDGSAGSSSKESKSKVSYIVLKSTSSTDPTASTVLKKSPAHTAVSKFWETDKTPKKPSPAENTTGPWLCERCGDGENTALQFDTYRTFRRHLVDVHKERIDARICEYCGQKASKRNLLLYHLYTKHGVQPPKNCTFPHCDRCDYVALSESLLNKHRQNHDVNKEFSCGVCNASFKSSSALQGHMAANLHRNKDTKVYECPYCRKPFVRNINLKAHIRSLHRDVARFEEMEDPRLPPDESLANRLIASSAGKRRQFPSILAAARGASHSGMVEFVTADNIPEGQTVSYVTADGQPIEILDPNTLTSLPLTLMSTGEDGMTTVSSPMTLGLDSQSTTSTEYVTSVSQDQQAVYVMDGAQGAVEIDMANMGLALAADGTVVYDGDDGSQNFIVQDMQGNQFRRMTGIDETGKPVVFLQMIGEADQIGQTMLDEGVAVEESAGSSQMYVPTSGMPIPVTAGGSDGQQVIFASTSADGTILEMVPHDGEGHHVMNETVLSHGQEMGEQQHLQLVQQEQPEGMQEVIHDEMGQPVQELHIILDQQETNRSEDHEQVEQRELEMVEVPQSESYIANSNHDELQLGGTYTQEDIQQLEQGHATDSAATEGTPDHVEVVTQEVSETEHMEIDEAETQQLQIEQDPHTLKLEECETQEMEVHTQETEILADDNLQGSIELVEGQTLTLIEEEDGTQTIKCVDSTNVEQVTS